MRDGFLWLSNNVEGGASWAPRDLACFQAEGMVTTDQEIKDTKDSDWRGVSKWEGMRYKNRWRASLSEGEMIFYGRKNLRDR